MAKTNHRKCDACGRVVENFRKEHGWINIRPFLNSKNTRLKVRVAHGGGHFKASTPSRLDFCNIDCLNDWFGERLPEPCKYCDGTGEVTFDGHACSNGCGGGREDKD